MQQNHQKQKLQNRTKLAKKALVLVKRKIIVKSTLREGRKYARGATRASSRGFWKNKCGTKHLESTGLRVEGCKRKYAEGRTPSKLERILGGKV